MPYKDTLHLPGGFVETQETALDALIREIKEELSIILDNNPIQYLFTVPNKAVYDHIEYEILDIYHWIKLDKKPRIKCSSDAKTYYWIEIKKINLNTIGFESVRIAVAKFKRNYFGIP